MTNSLVQTIGNALRFLFSKKYRKNIRFIKKIFIFKHLTNQERYLICDGIQEQAYQPGELIIEEGQLGTYFYIIKEGSVKVFTPKGNNQEMVLAKLDQYAYFGEQALMNEVPTRRSASIKAFTNVKVLKISHEHLKKSLNKDVKNILRRMGLWYSSQKDLKLKFDFLRLISEDLLQKLEGKMIDFTDGHVIFLQGDEPDLVYFILSGTVLIHIHQRNNPEQVIQLNTGQVFGELGILKKKPRAGTAVAKNNVKVLAIPAHLFSEIYYSTPSLRKSLEAREQLYKLSNRGRITIINSMLLGIPAVSIEYQLNDGRVVNAARAFDQIIFSMYDMASPPSETIKFEHGKSIKREIGMVENKIVSILVTGSWEELGFACGLLLDQTSINEWQKKLFKKTGSLGSYHFQSQNEIICYCMNVSREQLKNYIRAGNTDLDKLLTVSNAGQICGGCKPQIRELLGMINWTFVEVSTVHHLTDTVHLYRFIPQDSTISSYQSGQYIVLSTLINNKWIQRSYTLTSLYGRSNYYELAIKRKDQGYFSNWIFQHEKISPLIKMSQPQGDFILDLGNKTPAVFFAADIGITPAYAMARSLRKSNSKKPFFIHYSAHSLKDFLFINYFSEMADHQESFSFKMRVTSLEGRLKEKDITEVVHQYKNAIFYICGPESYRNFIVSVLKSNTISNEKIKIEIFTPL